METELFSSPNNAPTREGIGHAESGISRRSLRFTCFMGVYKTLKHQGSQTSTPKNKYTVASNITADSYLAIKSSNSIPEAHMHLTLFPVLYECRCLEHVVCIMQLWKYAAVCFDNSITHTFTAGYNSRILFRLS